MLRDIYRCLLLSLGPGLSRLRLCFALHKRLLGNKAPGLPETELEMSWPLVQTLFRFFSVSGGNNMTYPAPGNINNNAGCGHHVVIPSVTICKNLLPANQIKYQYKSVRRRWNKHCCVPASWLCSLCQAVPVTLNSPLKCWPATLAIIVK